ncbi:MAG: CinA family nicotinamide mononucleotide deamidase-related protein [Planctomycetota bacterium]|jgi:nicotinamide-nucleotide amidase|nr:CinA family nicotinamide mononucleotide deamidase-related protein [Planctomycetota bacterium]MDP6940046.1 CinA family nicotinamide mononucleotide deamidase-related protein [Planctomycetota bacterium]
MIARGCRAAALAVGDELLDGFQADLNSPALARFLGERGWSLECVHVVGDGEEAIAAALVELARDHALVLVSGGLGPTLDDLVRHGLARAAGVELEHNPEAWAQVQAWYQRSDRTPPPSNERQALLPRDARPLENARGTAPGVHMRMAGTDVFALPGPPREYGPMLEAHVHPWLADQGGDGTVRRVQRFHLFGISESLFADQVAGWMERESNPLMGVTAKDGVLSVRLVAEAADEKRAQELLEVRATEFTDRLGAHVFSEDESDPAQVLGAELISTGTSVTTAESCTGGALAQALTGVAGISGVFREGVVTYANQAKVDRLGVDGELLRAHGAVSGPVAEAMARGMAVKTGADLALATTGIAGPAGGTEDKPVGLVWFGVHFKGQTTSLERRWPPVGRERIRRWATAQALVLGLKAIRGQPLD